MNLYENKLLTSTQIAIYYRHELKSVPELLRILIKIKQTNGYKRTTERFKIIR